MSHSNWTAEEDEELRRYVSEYQGTAGMWGKNAPMDEYPLLCKRRPHCCNKRWYRLNQGRGCDERDEMDLDASEDEDEDCIVVDRPWQAPANRAKKSFSEILGSSAGRFDDTFSNIRPSLHFDNMQQQPAGSSHEVASSTCLEQSSTAPNDSNPVTMSVARKSRTACPGAMPEKIATLTKENKELQILVIKLKRDIGLKENATPIVASEVEVAMEAKKDLHKTRLELEGTRQLKLDLEKDLAQEKCKTEDVRKLSTAVIEKNNNEISSLKAALKASGARGVDESTQQTAALAMANHRQHDLLDESASSTPDCNRSEEVQDVDCKVLLKNPSYIWLHGRLRQKETEVIAAKVQEDFLKAELESCKSKKRGLKAECKEALLEVSKLKSMLSGSEEMKLQSDKDKLAVLEKLEEASHTEQQLHSRLKKLSAESHQKVQVLEEEKVAVQVQNEVLQKKLIDSNFRVEGTKEKVKILKEDYERQLRSLEREAIAAERTCKVLEGGLEEAKRRCQALEVELEGSAWQCRSLEECNSEMHRDFQALQQELNGARRNLQQLTNECEALRLGFGSECHFLEQGNADVWRYSQVKQELEQVRGELATEKSKHASAAYGASQMEEKLRCELNQAKHHLQNAEAEVKRKMQVLRDAELEMAAMREQEAQHVESVAQLQIQEQGTSTRLDEALKRLAGSKEAMQQANARALKLEIELQRSKLEAEELQARVQESDVKLRDQVHQAKDREQGLKDQAEAELVRLQAKYSKACDTQAAAEMDSKKLRAQVKGLKEEKEELGASMVLISNQLQSSMKNLAAMHAEKAKLVEERDEAYSMVNELQVQLTCSRSNALLSRDTEQLARPEERGRSWQEGDDRSHDGSRKYTLLAVKELQPNPLPVHLAKFTSAGVGVVPAASKQPQTLAHEPLHSKRSHASSDSALQLLAEPLDRRRRLVAATATAAQDEFSPLLPLLPHRAVSFKPPAVPETLIAFDSSPKRRCLRQDLPPVGIAAQVEEAPSPEPGEIRDSSLVSSGVTRRRPCQEHRRTVFDRLVLPVG